MMFPVQDVTDGLFEDLPTGSHALAFHEVYLTIPAGGKRTPDVTRFPPTTSPDVDDHGEAAEQSPAASSCVLGPRPSGSIRGCERGASSAFSITTRSGSGSNPSSPRR
jgi:hypothetical protein